MVAVVQAGDGTDMIPLLDNNGSGVYNKGRNNKRDFQREFLGALVTKSGSAPFAWRQGILCPAANSGHSMTDGQLSQVGGGAGAQAVGISAHRSILTRASGEVYLFSQETAVASLPMPAADGSLPRIDLVCEMAYDQGAVPSDAQHGPKYIVVTGDPAASPTIPALPAAVADAFILGRVARPAGDNTIGTADLTLTRKGSGLHGAPRVLLEGDTIGESGTYHGEQRLRLGTQFIHSDYVGAGYVSLVDRWNAVGGVWSGTQSIHLPKPIIATTASLGGAQTFTLATVQIPDPGWPYRLDVSGSLLYSIPGGSSASLRDVYLQFNVNSTSFTPPAADLIRRIGSAGTPSPCVMDLKGRRSAVLFGANSVSFLIRNDSTPSNFLTWGDNEYAHCSISILPA